MEVIPKLRNNEAIASVGMIQVKTSRWFSTTSISLSMHQSFIFFSLYKVPTRKYLHQQLNQLFEILWKDYNYIVLNRQTIDVNSLWQNNTLILGYIFRNKNWSVFKEVYLSWLEIDKAILLVVRIVSTWNIEGGTQILCTYAKLSAMLEPS